MANEQPWFKFYAADYLLDPKVDAIPREAEALLLRMWCICHREGSCPTDIETLARKTLCEPQYVSRWKTHCEAFFELQDGKLYSRRMQKEKRRSEQARRNANNRVYPPKSKSKPKSDSKSESEVGSASGSANCSANASANGSANGSANQTLGADAPPPAPGPAPKSRSSQLPPGFEPTTDHQTLARELGVDLETAFAAFTDYHLSRGSVFRDWPRALNTWLRNEPKFAPKGVRSENRAQQREADNLAANAAAKRAFGLVS